MILFSPLLRAEFSFIVREDGRSTLMISRDRSKFPCHAVLLLTMLLGLPRASSAATLEDSAKELARKAAAELRAGESVAVEVSNRSSLRPEEVTRIQQAFLSELRDRGTSVNEGNDAGTKIGVTLSENWNELVWTAEIRAGDASHVTLLAVARMHESQTATNAMHVTVRGSKFWEGPERILDATEIHNSAGKSWLLLLLPSVFEAQDLQTGAPSTLDLSAQLPHGRDPWGEISTSPLLETVLGNGSTACKVNLDPLALTECFPQGRTIRFGSVPPAAGERLELRINPVCGGTDQFLATSARDDTQPDSLQVFQSEPGSATAMSGFVDFPGPIVALHPGVDGVDAPRAIVRNLATGNYEAYRLEISCGQ